MKTFFDIMSKKDWMINSVCSFLTIAVLFQPSLTDLLILLFVDFLALIPIQLLDKKVFLKIYPDAKSYFRIDHDHLKHSTDDEKINIFQSLVKFPERRSLYLMIGTFIKVIPACLIVVFVWDHNNSYIYQTIKFYCVDLFTICFFYSASFANLRNFVTSKIEEFHQQFNWDHVFIKIQPTTDANSYLMKENIGLIAMAFWCVVLIFVSMIQPGLTQNQMILNVLTIVLSAFVLMGRILYLHRNHFIHALNVIFKKVSHVNLYNQEKLISLHTSPIISNFEIVFNEMIVRIRKQEKELVNWLVFETEQSRFRAMGEIGGLVVHDLGGPLQGLQYSIETLQENKTTMNIPERYINQLELNTERALSLVSSLRSFLRNPNLQNDDHFFDFYQTHEYNLRLLSTIFKSPIFATIQFEFDQELRNLKFQFPQVGVFQILYNLYKNSVENFIKNKQKNGVIKIKLESKNSEDVTFSITDNGTGLDIAKFNNMTGHDLIADDFRGGLGLKLLSSFIKRNKGSFKLNPIDQGTSFHITLKLLDESTAQDLNLQYSNDQMSEVVTLN